MPDIIERLATCSRQLLDAGAEIERLQNLITQVANDSRVFMLHERTKELLRPF